MLIIINCLHYNLIDINKNYFIIMQINENKYIHLYYNILLSNINKQNIVV